MNWSDYDPNEVILLFKQEIASYNNLVCPKMRKSTVSTEVVNAKTVTLASSHDIAQPTMMNVLHVKIRVTG